MQKFIKYMHSSFDNASRNKRELSVVADFNCEIIICDFGPEEGFKKIDGFTVLRRTKSLSENSWVRKAQILFNWFIKEPWYLRSLEADFISCHDLIALLIGWISTWSISGKKPLLVYDSHEFEIGRNTGGKRSKLAQYLIPKVEKYLMNRCAFSIMVNDSIADEVQKIHKLKNRPVVVRNIPNYWDIDSSICKSKRQELLGNLYNNQEMFVLMYHGVVTRGRGIETILKAVAKSEETAAVILGNGETSYIEELKGIAEQLQISRRVIFRPAVEINILWKYVGAADVGMVIGPLVSLSYYYSLPNKLFENIQAETPLIASNFPEISKIINEYDVGLLVDPENVDEIARAIEKMRNDKQLYTQFKLNLKKAKKELCWENERKVLEAAYAKILTQEKSDD